MKIKLFLLLTTLYTLNCFSQIDFEKGYFISNSDEKIECLIKNMDWKNNPIDFKYKLSENGEIKGNNIENVKEFGVYNVSKYVRETVEIDRSSEITNRLSTKRKPIFNTEQLFLEVLVEGSASLYFYGDADLDRFFYKLKNSEIEQLIFKSYKTDKNKVGENHRFKQQLLNNLECSSIKDRTIENLNYSKKSLVDFFVKYNTCINSELVNYEKKKKRDIFNLTLRPRMNISSLTLENPEIGSYGNIDFGNETGFGFGVEFEFILPFNKNKWALMIEPTYQQFKSEKLTKNNGVSGDKLTTEIDYASIELHAGLRYYFFLNDNSKIFADFAFVFDKETKSTINFKRSDASILNSLEFETKNNFAFGLGYKFKDKYSVEVRYLTSRDLLGNYSLWSSDFQTFSFILGYSIF